jgi:hypothetical protein
VDWQQRPWAGSRESSGEGHNPAREMRHMI